MFLLPTSYATEAGKRGVMDAGKQVAKGWLEGAEHGLCFW